MTYLRKFLIFFLARILSLFVKLWIKTLKIEYLGKEKVRQALSSKPGYLFILWHDSLFLTPLLKWIGSFQETFFLISKSKDGDIPAEIVNSHRHFHALRVPHNARAQVLLETVELLQSGKGIIITPDGPRGPRRVMKKGSIFALEKTQAKPILITWKASKEWHLSSWDRFRIPVPFSKVIFSYHLIEEKPQGTSDEWQEKLTSLMLKDEEACSFVTEGKE